MLCCLPLTRYKIFVQPTEQEMRARMPPPLPEEATVVVPSVDISEEQKPAPVGSETETTPFEDAYVV